MLPHTADLRFLLKGDSMRELFTAGIEALASVLKGGACTEETHDVMKRIELSAADTTRLLIDFLSEVLVRSQTEGIIYCDVTFRDLTEMHLDAEIRGVRVHQFDTDVKAVTYHEARVENDADGWYTSRVVLDI